MSLVRYAITVSGKVQGVWYRAATVEFCSRHGIGGFVKNLPNGKVYMEAEAEPSRLGKLIDWCKQGPLLARVGEVVYHEISVVGEKEFRIIRD